MEGRLGGPRWSGHRPALVQLLRQPADEGWWKVGLIYLNGTYRMYARHHGGSWCRGRLRSCLSFPGLCQTARSSPERHLQGAGALTTATGVGSPAWWGGGGA